MNDKIILRLKELRIEHGYSQKLLSEYLGVSQQAYSLYELSFRELSYSSLIKISKFYNVSLDYLFGLSDIK